MKLDHFPTLLRVFIRDLVRRKAPWLLALLVVAALVVEYWIGSVVPSPAADLVPGAQPVLSRAQALLKLRIAELTISRWGILAVLALSAMFAPESRRNGTTAFFLCLGVGRLPLAVAQYTSLALFLAAGALIAHVGYCFAAWSLDQISLSNALFAWLCLLLPFLLVAAAAFSLSLTRGAMETCAILIGIPLAAFAGARMLGDSESEPSLLVMLLDHIRLAFPDLGRSVAFWPRPAAAAAAIGLRPAVQSLVSIAFWVTLGLWLYLRRDLGSRAATT